MNVREYFLEVYVRPPLSDDDFDAACGAFGALAKRVDTFVQDHLLSFFFACQSGVHFSRLEPAYVQKLLRQFFEKDESSVICLLFPREAEVWPTEEELVERLSAALEDADFREVHDACRLFEEAYTQKNDYRAGYYLLWLLKHFSKADFQLPEQKSFDESTVQTVLTEFLDEGVVPVRFIELIFLPKYAKNPLRLSQDARLISLASSALCLSPWPTKTRVLVEFLSTWKPEELKELASLLETSPHAQTQQIGHHLVQAFKAKTMKEQIPHFYDLIDLLPGFGKHEIERLFGCIFLNKPSQFGEDPAFIKRVPPGRSSFIVGEYRVAVHSSSQAPEHILGFNLKTEKLEWGIPLEAQRLIWNIDYRLDVFNGTLALQYTGQNFATLIDPSSGEKVDSIKFPNVRQTEGDRIYLTPNGFGYQMVQRQVVGGPIVDSQLKPAFEFKAPSWAGFCPLSTHLGFLNRPESILTLYGPTGCFKTFSCQSVKAFGDKLYMIQSTEEGCQLVMRTLQSDETVVGEPEKVISLQVKEASIEELSDEGHLYLHSNESPIFVNLNSLDVVYSELRFKDVVCLMKFNKAIGELWSWNQHTGEIHKVSARGIELMGSSKSNPATPLYFDQDKVYVQGI